MRRPRGDQEVQKLLQLLQYHTCWVLHFFISLCPYASHGQVATVECAGAHRCQKLKEGLPKTKGTVQTSGVQTQF